MLIILDDEYNTKEDLYECSKSKKIVILHFYYFFILSTLFLELEMTNFVILQLLARWDNLLANPTIENVVKLELFTIRPHCTLG